MINLHLINDVVYVFNLNDYEKLRKQHRIVGKIAGSSLTAASMPVILLPEEVYLLVTRKLANVVTLPEITEEPLEEAEKKFKNYTEELYKEEQVVFKEIRRKELEGMIDKIVEGKCNKDKDDVAIIHSKKEILEQELEKSGNISEQHMLWPIVTKHYNELTGKLKETPLTEILKHTTNEKCKVFDDLWNKGYYITSGNKFGGEFLAYLENECIFHPCELVALGRLSTSVKKRTVFAFVKSNNEISYYTLSWFDS
ncbi:tRNA-splicing endonuclease subunit Sen34 isoform X2 [Agrilus planipennis]|uniref:tRNA-intron lyase n=1 Tax=Agrilus planipennis TaxID=224129 RepID=A0A1W4XST1_AGRPL|nr:tRNA-splicing endonuclease subunit Sen34 isoform X2 [Agrilus planipennis]